MYTVITLITLIPIHNILQIHFHEEDKEVLKFTNGIQFESGSRYSHNNSDRIRWDLFNTIQRNRLKI